MLADQIWDYIDKNGPGGCWLWCRSFDTWGYGQVWVDQVKYSTHRFIWEMYNGPIPKGFCVCHSCDNPPCCNPDHLFLGTHDDNMRDMKEKGRSNGGAPAGEGNGRAKITWEEVKTIRKMLNRGTPARVLSRKFGISIPQIYKIKNNNSWKTGDQKCL